MMERLVQLFELFKLVGAGLSLVWSVSGTLIIVKNIENNIKMRTELVPSQSWFSCRSVSN